MVWISRNGSARVGASGIGPAISTWARHAFEETLETRGTRHYSRAKTLKDKHVADRKMIRAIGHLPGRKTLTEHVVKKIMQAKTRINL